MALVTQGDSAHLVTLPAAALLSGHDVQAPAASEPVISENIPSLLLPVGTVQQKWFLPSFPKPLGLVGDMALTG